MRISLLRGTTVPDPEADLGVHRFAYAVMPHAGGWREAGVVAEAARFETPLRWLPGSAAPRSFLSIDDPNLVIDTVKRAEDSDALLVRLYEAHGGRGRGRLQLGWPVREALRCNLLEDPGDPMPVADGAIEIAYRPHEIVSLLLT
jgi:alpha-mannosidase